MLRQRFLGAIAAGFTCLHAMLAAASASSLPVLEQEAQSEFTKTGEAVRERLAREAAGDLIGARIAERDADTHRYRFLDIQRELGHLHSPSPTAPSVAASRSPFSPDPSFFDGSASSSNERKERLPPRLLHRAWDMYQPRESPASTGARAGAGQKQDSPVALTASGTGDMYSHGFAPRVADKERAADNPLGSFSSGEVPREPFLVYRARGAGGEMRE